MKRATKILSLILAVLLILPLMFSCKKEEQEEPESSEVEANDKVVTTEVESETLRLDENGYLMDDLPEELDFGGKEVRILAWEEAEAWYDLFTVDRSDLSTPMKRSTFLRNSKTEQRLNVKLKFDMIPGNNKNLNDYIQKCATVYQESAYDIFASYSQASATLTINGYTADLLQTDYFDFEKPWWAPGLVENGQLHGRLYFAAGDIAPSYLANGVIMYYNKTMADEYLTDALTTLGVSTLYELVNEGNWTIDEMIKLSKLAALDENGVKEKTDQFGFVTSGTNIDMFYQACGMLTARVAEDGSMMISEELGSEKTHNLLKKLNDFLQTSAGGYPKAGEASYTGAFEQNRSLFISAEAQKALTYKETDGLTFGVLPLPKYDTEQERYYTTNAYTYTIYSILRNGDIEMASAALECLASEGYRTTAPTLYETLLKEQSSNASDDYKMWSVIRDSVVVDAGRIFTNELNYHPWQIFRTTIQEAMKGTNPDYASRYATAALDFEYRIGILNDTMFDLEALYGALQ